MKKLSLVLAALLAVTAAPVFAEDAPTSTPPGEAVASPPVSPLQRMQQRRIQAAGPMSPATQAYRFATMKMHQNMSAPLTGDADIDFVNGMIGHHQGAIDMAKVVLQYGKDEEIKKLAEGIIKAQEGEIEQMKAWLEKHPAPAGLPVPTRPHLMHPAAPQITPPTAPKAE